MDLNYSAEDLAFRDEVRNYLEANLPADLQHKVLNHKRMNKSDFVRWHKILARQGWVATGWPREYGGTGWSPTQRHIFEEECARVGTPAILPFGVAMVAPVIMAFGNQAQKDYYLPRILNCDDWWCQGYSEPGSGSDLASLKTRAERDGDFYIVNGQKTWTTLAQHADMIFCLVRTEPNGRKQEGISFLLIDMKTPGITVRPIIMLDEDHEVNEVFFDNVKVPVQNLIGEENKGWTYAKYLLGHERTNIAAVGRAKRELQFLKRIAGEQQKNGLPLIDDAVFANKVAQLEIELMALEITVLRVISQDSGKPGPEASLLKIKGTEIQQILTELMLEAVGPYGLPFDTAFLEGEQAHSVTGDDDAAALASYYFNYRKTSIYGGSNEIQKNIITQMILGL
ncbi:MULTISPECIES: acyl-CoA dehydrogenase family protein [unclassified Undibacterium]|uniref:acyl-CoA dehydrogenase family protein n=1 Tax=unclassified Undibacterium TaxID=2630295 RepID=UPI002AC95E8B|nr:MULTISPECIES: acyl-CoA dehydrogenase family protein [unclassified Undibacterium]MEB0139114.1 acyl-CoA dehydrogenase family protein [Undibacterium sp. CCC2.1]MEB0173333.1 acyl-CoA dehydrogenase family protein [Undibacterium sp. CCC1.1]MEB0177627.1 acyl-CoA dehydrogenase family protein [Undibacterium sp. CCC3.4]MEB0216809.1 acyl-CoA dehydrogenase family protein [Undibacterium sp. 5I2]WPX43109.1 acyl-CoA dehydrogenase family protein [Undibacterium sp. CCC3.4]